MSLNVELIMQCVTTLIIQKKNIQECLSILNKVHAPLNIYLVYNTYNAVLNIITNDMATKGSIEKFLRYIGGLNTKAPKSKSGDSYGFDPEAENALPNKSIPIELAIESCHMLIQFKTCVDEALQILQDNPAPYYVYQKYDLYTLLHPLTTRFGSNAQDALKVINLIFSSKSEARQQFTLEPRAINHRTPSKRQGSDDIGLHSLTKCAIYSTGKKRRIAYDQDFKAEYDGKLSARNLNAKKDLDSKTDEKVEKVVKTTVDGKTKDTYKNVEVGCNRSGLKIVSDNSN